MRGRSCNEWPHGEEHGLVHGDCVYGFGAVNGFVCLDGIQTQRDSMVEISFAIIEGYMICTQIGRLITTAHQVRKS